MKKRVAAIVISLAVIAASAGTAIASPLHVSAKSPGHSGNLQVKVHF